MVMWWIGVACIVIALITFLVSAGLSLVLRAQRKSDEDRNKALKTWHQAIAVLAVGGIGLAILSQFIMSDEEREIVRKLTAPREPPEIIKYKPLVPITVTLRRSLVGAGTVVQIQNNSKTLLEGVIVRGEHSPKNLQEDYAVGRLMPEAVVEIGWTKWKWKAEVGETLSVAANGYNVASFQLTEAPAR